MKTFLLSLLFLELFALHVTVDLNTYYKDFMKTYGYELEENTVTTPDGYILSIWHLTPRMPNGKVVFFQHGLTDTAWTFFQLGGNSLPFFLLDEGFDVWLGNIRGNVFSYKHVTKEPKDFNYTMDDFVEYDLPTMINYVKSRTGIEKVSYIGHSQGTTIFFMLAMHNPTFAESSIDKYVALGTVPNIAYTHFTPIEIMDKIAGILKAVNIFNTFTLTNSQRSKVSNYCKDHPDICGDFFDAGTAIKPTGRMDYTNLYHYMYYYPGGVNKINFLQWSQIHKMKKLVYYNPNFEKEKTAKSYNYDNIKKWKINSLIAITDDDTFSSYEDVYEFYNTVEDKSYVQLLDLVNYAHVDVTAAKSAVYDVFYPILNFFYN